MSAVNEYALNNDIGWLYVIPKVDLTATFLNDMSNSETLRAELDALTFTRVASITDLQLSTNLSDNLVEIETDDTGVIATFTRPAVTISGNWFESWDIDVLKIVLGVSSADEVWPPASTNWGMNLTKRDIPELILKIVTVADDNGSVNTTYLYNAGLSGEIIAPFLDPVRAGDIPGSAFEFVGKKGGFVLVNSQAAKV